MMLNLTVVGNLGSDAVVAYTQNQTAVANLSIACQYGMKDQNTGDKPTQWVEAALWGKQAEALAQYLTKGTKVVAVLRDAHIETYQKRDGGEGFKLVGSVLEISFAGSNQGQQQQGQGYQQQGQAYQPQQQGGYYQQQPAPQAATAAQGNVAAKWGQAQNQPHPQASQAYQQPAQAQQGQDFSDFDDTIPF